ncbi:hypothetical protein Slin14017_G055600 [Septoria linicola]|nr:hypothetical protein Slin14017_G055600 [Septoria linicola]
MPAGLRPVSHSTPLLSARHASQFELSSLIVVLKIPSQPKQDSTPLHKPKRKARVIRNPSVPIDKICRLLDKTPAELRNSIYELVLLDHCSIEEEEGKRITKKTFHLPALLRTCKQILAEAGPIYYGPENSFTFHSRDFNGLALKHFCNASRGLWITHPPRVQVELGRGMQAWGKLVGWLKWYFQGEVPGYECKVECEGHACCAGHAAFQIVDRMPKGLDWEQVVLPVLEIHRKTTEKSRRLHWRG